MNAKPLEDDLPLVYYAMMKWVAYRASRGYRELVTDDLRQEACLLACRARTKYDPERGAAWPTYLFGSVFKGLNWAHNKKEEKRLPSGRRLLEFSVLTADLPAFDPTDGRQEAAEDDRLGREDAKARIADALNRLALRRPRLASILRDRLRDLSLTEVGRRHGLSKERVRQLEVQAHAAMKRLLETVCV